MSIVGVLWIIGVYSVVCGGFSAWWALVKHYWPGQWFVFGFCFGVFALIAIAGAPESKRVE